MEARILIEIAHLSARFRVKEERDRAVELAGEEEAKMKKQMDVFGTQIVAILVCGLLLGGGTLAVRAQDNTGNAPSAAGQGDTQPGPGGHRGHGDSTQMEQRRLDMMTKRLSLTPDQVTQVKAIMDDTHTQMMALRNVGGSSTGAADTSAGNGGPTPDQRAKMMSLHQAEQTRIRAILTDDQRSKLDAMEARARERRQNGGNDGPPPVAPQQ